MAKLQLPFSEAFFEEVKSCGIKDARLVLSIHGTGDGFCQYNVVLSALDAQHGIIIESVLGFYWGPLSADKDDDPFHGEYQQGLDKVKEWLEKMKKKHPEITVKDGRWVEQEQK